MMNRFITLTLASITLISVPLHAGLLDWFGRNSDAQFQQIDPDASIIGHLTGTKISVVDLENRLADRDTKVAVTFDTKDAHGIQKKGHFTPVQDGIFIMKWHKAGIDQTATRVLDIRDKAENLLPDLSEIVKPYEENFRVYYGDPAHERIQMLQELAS